ncbi:MAG TPA: cytochrome c oxidase subunit II [Candidatus Binataceae bacterium]|nr:cytochrome c oxidase subunit II [Candidatus Binataceae bacterium]
MLERYLWFPHDVSTFGPKIDNLFLVIFWLVMVVWIGTMVTFVVFLFKYRTRPGRKAEYLEGSNTLEVIWTSATVVIFLVLAIASRSTWAEIKEGGPPGDVFNIVTAKQFNWEMTYPGPDGKLGTKDDVTIENELHVPVNKVVRIDLTSKDVIHSFYLPNLRLRQDAVPGRTIHIWFEATETGQYEIPCSQLCGFGHSGMQGNMTVESEADYAKWLKDQYAQSH